MTDAVWAALIGGAFGIASGLITGILSSRHQLSQFRQERFAERETRFEKAQTGYRACYRKFLVNVAACHGGGKGIPLKDQERTDINTLLDNFWEASFTGDPTVIAEMEKYWPAEQRSAGELPEPTPPSGLLEAMRKHGVRPLAEQVKEQDGFLAAVE